MTPLSSFGAYIAYFAVLLSVSALPTESQPINTALAATPNTPDSGGCQRLNPDVANGSLIDQLWKKNCDLVNKFLNNAFSKAQAEQLPEGTLESFKYYSVQDYYYLLATAPHKAFLLKSSSPGDSEPEQVTNFNGALDSMRSNLEYASSFRHNLTSLEHLGVPDDVVRNGYLQAAPLGYVKWLEENIDSGWFSLQVARIACIYGWAELAHHLDQLPTTNKTSKFYKEWIVPSLDWSYGSGLSSKIEKGVPSHVNKETFKNYNRIFRQGLSFEIAFFESAINKTLKDVLGSR